MTSTPNITTPPRRTALKAIWVIRGVVVGLILVAIGVIWVSNNLLTARFTETTRNRSELRLALYSNAITSELKRAQVVPLLMSRDPVMIQALSNNDFATTSQRLISFREEIGVAALRLLDDDGRVVASSDRNELGANQRSAQYFVSAVRANDTVFSVNETESGGFLFTYSRRIERDRRSLGVIVVEVNMRRFEQEWRRASEAVLVMDSTGTIIIATDPRWRSRKLDDALTSAAPRNALERAFQATNVPWDFNSTSPDAYLEGQAVMQLETRIPFRGWRLISFSTYTSVRERVNAVLALEIMAFAILTSLAFYILSRRARSEAGMFRRESEALRALNTRLSREIAEREKVQRTLEVAEQSLAQSQKLAALGEMSAAVSHELNQPLAAMKTYLAGAKLLLQRKRPDEAESSLQRIDDLIDRMGVITRQLKSYARKGGDAFEPLDFRSAVSGALSMMEPQLKRGDIAVQVDLPDEPVMIEADRLRLEQVIINLFRNALDATKKLDRPRIELLLTAGETATFSLRDNGPGIGNLDELFEPFYTTKEPGEGVGLGLAISSGIVGDMGGRLTARNGQSGGAVFEIKLPLLGGDALVIQVAQ